MAKNPWMSAYLSTWNKAANSARGRLTGAVKAEQKKATTSAINSWFDAFTPPSTRKSTTRKSTAKKSAAKRKPSTARRRTSS